MTVFHLLSTDLISPPVPVEFSIQKEKSKGKIFLLQSMMHALCGQALAAQVMLPISFTEVPCAHSPDQGLLCKAL